LSIDISCNFRCAVSTCVITVVTGGGNSFKEEEWVYQHYHEKSCKPDSMQDKGNSKKHQTEINQSGETAKEWSKICNATQRHIETCVDQPISSPTRAKNG